MSSPHPYARELGDFLRARRSRLRPHDVGLVPGGRRQVTGLRREQLALALDYIGMMRAAVATDPRATAIVGELSIRSAEFRRLWARHDVRESVSGTETFRVPEVGDIVLDWDTYPLPGNPGPVMLVFTVEPGSADAERLRLLASLHATRSVPADRPSC
jgi:hypothetical protein